MRMIVGLGNFGSEYDNTPHNVGFAALEIFANSLGEKFKKKQKNGLIILTEYEGQEILLVKPLTYMNNSGECVFALAKKYNINANDICVVLDDIDLTAGLCRVRPSGSAGTHNGLRSVTNRLGTIEFTRIRIGVDCDYRGDDLAEFVLTKMPPELKQDVLVGVEKAVKYIQQFAKGEEISDTK